MTMSNWSKLTALLGWCALVNYALMLVWFAVLTGGELCGGVACAGAQNWYFEMHRAIGIHMTDEALLALHFGLYGQMKMLVFIFNLVPFLVLLALGRAERKAAA